MYGNFPYHCFREAVEQVIATTHLTHSENIYEFLRQKLFLPQQTIILYSISFNVPFFFLPPPFFPTTGKEESVATFKGNEFFCYDLSLTPIQSSTDEITLSFRTLQRNGLMLHTGKSADYVNLSLKSGAVWLVINLGSGAFEALVEPVNGKFNDNAWHDVRVTRNLRQVNTALVIQGHHSREWCLFLPPTLSYPISAALFDSPLSIYVNIYIYSLCTRSTQGAFVWCSVSPFLLVASHLNRSVVFFSRLELRGPLLFSLSFTASCVFLLFVPD